MVGAQEDARRLRELILNDPRLVAIKSTEMLRLALADKRHVTRYHRTVLTSSIYEAIDDAEWEQVPEAEKAAVSELLAMFQIEVAKDSRAMRKLMAAFPLGTATGNRIVDLVSKPTSMLEEANLPEPTLHQLEVARTIPWPIRI